MSIHTLAALVMVLEITLAAVTFMGAAWLMRRAIAALDKKAGIR
jgi:hypothetical protein